MNQYVNKMDFYIRNLLIISGKHIPIIWILFLTPINGDCDCGNYYVNEICKIYENSIDEFFKVGIL